MTSTQARPELPQLCSICRLVAPKYCCPRCSTRTCSLPCTKRHKQWAQCSGVRDPGAYLKRHEIATPAAFDRDYNFIAGLERKIEGADREAGSRGIQLRSVEQQLGRKRHAEKGEIPLQRAMEACGVMLDKAPVGMSRNTSNHTSWSKRQKCIQWTVEWIYGELGSHVREVGSMLETMTFKTAFQEHLAANQRNSKKKMEVNIENSEPRQKRQKRGSRTFEERKDTENQVTEERVSKQIGKGPDTKHWEREESDSIMVDKTIKVESTTTTPDSHPELHFYIHQTRPTRQIPKTALLAVERTRNLSECLRGVTVREYPTIYALALSPEQVSRSGEYLLEPETAYTLPKLADVAAEAEGNVINGPNDAEEGELAQPEPSNVVDFDEDTVNAE